MFALRNEQSLHKTIGFEFQQMLFDLHVKKDRIERDIRCVEEESFKELAQRDQEERDARKNTPNRAFVECLKGCGKMFSLRIRDPIEPIDRCKVHLAECRGNQMNGVLPLVVRIISEWKGDSDKIVDHISTTFKLTQAETETALAYLIENRWIDKATKQLTDFGRKAMTFIV